VLPSVELHCTNVAIYLLAKVPVQPAPVIASRPLEICLTLVLSRPAPEATRKQEHRPCRLPACWKRAAFGSTMQPSVGAMSGNTQHLYGARGGSSSTARHAAPRQLQRRQPKNCAPATCCWSRRSRRCSASSRCLRAPQKRCALRPAHDAHYQTSQPQLQRPTPRPIKSN